MGLLIKLEQLGSRLTRKAVTGGQVRKFATSALGAQTSSNPIFDWWNGFARYVGFILSKTIEILSSFVQFSFTALWGALVQGTAFLWNFNWNEPDEEIYKSIESGFRGLAGLAGFVIGDVLGFVVCGFAPTALIGVFNEPLALHIYEQLGEQAAAEIAGNLAALIQQAGITTAQAALSYVYVNVRSLFRDSNEKFKEKLISKGITNKEQIQKAIEQRNKPWSFALQFNKSVAKIPNEFVREIVQQGVAGFVNSCVESGYVIAGGMDSFLAAAKTANNGILGKEEAVEILLGRKPGATHSPSSNVVH